MTIEDAISILRKSNEKLQVYINTVLPKAIKSVADNVRLCFDGYETLDKCKREYEAVNLAVEALREKAQREQGCEYCDFSSGSCGAIFDGEEDFFLITPDNLHEFYIATDGKGIFRETKIHLCPNCGRKLDGGEKRE